jgi:uncharacterized UPF0160 family protein
MPLRCATHDGPFHADDVLAFGLLRCFVDAEATIDRSRDPSRHAAAEVVFDVGGIFDPAAGRFDHHQASYEGPLSSAGMVLGWLESSQKVSAGLAAHLRAKLVNYVDDVDNGRVAPRDGVPCFASMVDALNQPASNHPEYDAAFVDAATYATAVVRGLAAEHRAIEEADAVVAAAMDDAIRDGRRVLFLDTYVRWKPPYFERGGAQHPTDFVLFPGTDGSWRVISIPPEPASFAQKRSLPEAWAGLTDEALEAVTGIPGSVFCHKNRFIAVFRTREGAIRALEQNGLLRS